MPLTFGIPLGLVIVVVGAILFFATRYKTLAKLVIGFGLAASVMTVILVVLVVNSNM